MPIQVHELCPGSYLLEIKEADVSWVFTPFPDICKFIIQKGLSFNGVVCPDTRIQGGVNCNLIEFPLLYALFNKQMIFRGEKPALLGTRPQLKQASMAFKRSLYGYYNSNEMLNCDLTEREKRQVMKEIRGLSFNGIKPTHEVIEEVVLEPLEGNPKESDATEFKGVKIWKKDINKFEIQWQGESVEIDANLKAGERFKPPLKIDIKNIPLTLFQIIDTGEEDGFSTKSCLHTVVQWREKIICVDLPMNVSYLLEKISISRFEIDAVIFTHCHDDHVGDISMLMQLDKKITVICPKIIWRSILMKVSAMLSMDMKELSGYFNYLPIKYGEELNYSGLRIMAHPSIHSVPCAIYRMRAMVDGVWKTYSHLSDILNLKRAKKLLSDKVISSKRYREYKEFLQHESDIKKVDVGTIDGQEMISVHGSWKDFLGDKTKHVVLAHIREEALNQKAKILVGQFAAPGSTRDLSSGFDHAYLDKYVERAIHYLGEYLFSMLQERLDNRELKREQVLDSMHLLANQEIVLIQPNTPFLKKGEKSTFVDMVVSGIGSIWRENSNSIRKIASIQAGDVIGEMGVLEGVTRNASVIADTYMRVLRIHGELFKEEMISLGIYKRTRKDSILQRVWSNRSFIQKTGILNQEVPVYLQNKLSKYSEVQEFRKGDLVFGPKKSKGLMIATDPNSYQLKVKGKDCVHDDPYPVFGEENFIAAPSNLLEVRAKKKTKFLFLPREKCKWIEEVPIFKLRFKELNEHRRVNLLRQVESLKSSK